MNYEELEEQHEQALGKLKITIDRIMKICKWRLEKDKKGCYIWIADVHPVHRKEFKKFMRKAEKQWDGNNATFFQMRDMDVDRTEKLRVELVDKVRKDKF